MNVIQNAVVHGKSKWKNDSKFSLAASDWSELEERAKAVCERSLTRRSAKEEEVGASALRVGYPVGRVYMGECPIDEV